MLRTIRHKLIATSLLAVVVPLIVIGLSVARLLWEFYLDQRERELEAQAFVIADAATPHLREATAENRRALFSMINRWRYHSNVRVTIVDAQGVVCAATASEDVGTRITEATRPGVLSALRGNLTTSVWKSPRFDNQDTLYVNVPVRASGVIIGAVRVANTLTQVQQSFARIRLTLAGGFIVYALLIVGLTVRLARSIVGPVEELNRGAQRLAEGNWEQPLQVDGSTEVSALAQSLNRLTAHLRQQEANRRQFVSNVSHELRTPLTGIRSMVETLEEHGESDPDLARSYLPRISAQTDRLARLTAQLLDLAEIEGGNLTFHPQPLALREVMDDALHTCEASAARKGVTVNSSVSPRLPEMRGDYDRLAQVFINLLDNAIRYTPAGGKVEIAACEQAGALRIDLSDTGCGIAAEHLPHLFERFYRVDKARSRQHGGNGLGLAVVEQIVSAHGGSVTVASAVGRGTVFTIVLPLRATGAWTASANDGEDHGQHSHH